MVQHLHFESVSGNYAFRFISINQTNYVFAISKHHEIKLVRGNSKYYLKIYNS